MIKNIIIGIVLSLAAVFWLKEIAYLLTLLNDLHHWLSHLLSYVIAGGKIGRVIRDTLVLFLIPLIVALIPFIIYKLVAKKHFEYFAHVFWGVWLILITTIALR